MKRIVAKSLALLLAMLVLASCAGGGSAAKAVAKVNDVEISSETLTDWIEYYMNYNYMAIPESMDSLTDEEREQIEQIRDDALDQLIDEQVQLQKAKEDGLDQLTDEELAEVDADVKTTMDGWYDSFTSEVANEGALGGEEAAAETKKRYDAFIEETGYNKEYVTETLRKNKILTKLQEKYYAELEPTEEQLFAMYEERVAEEKTRYTDDPDSYADDVAYTTPLYSPGGYRRISHILLSPTSEQQEEIYNLQSAGSEAEAEAKEAEYMEQAKVKADEVHALLVEGADFTATQSEYTTDLDYYGEPNQPEGYILNSNTTYLVSEFVAAGMALANIGDISEPVKTDYGYHILKYEEDITESTTPFEEVPEETLDEFKNSIVSDGYLALVEQWKAGMTIEKMLDNVVYPLATPSPSASPEATDDGAAPAETEPIVEIGEETGEPTTPATDSPADSETPAAT